MGENKDTMSADSSRSRIPLVVKVAFSLFMAVMVPCYLYQYGPLNFLWFCDVAMIVTLFALWLESPLLAGSQATAILLPQLAWNIDYVIHLLTGKSPIFGLTNYMFDDHITVFNRFLSGFHGWLPLLLLWLVWKLGYDRRSWYVANFISMSVLMLSFFLVTTDDEAGAGNVNKIFGFVDGATQTWMPPVAWLGTLILIQVFVISLPSHFLLSWLMPARRDRAGPSLAAD